MHAPSQKRLEKKRHPVACMRPARKNEAEKKTAATRMHAPRGRKMRKKNGSCMRPRDLHALHACASESACVRGKMIFLTST